MFIEHWADPRLSRHALPRRPGFRYVRAGARPARRRTTDHRDLRRPTPRRLKCGEALRMIITTTRGKVEASTRRRSVEALGIPFVCLGRLSAPVPVESWSTTLDATEFGPASLQPPGEVFMAVDMPLSESPPLPRRVGTRSRRREHERCGSSRHGVDPRWRVPPRLGRGHVCRVGRSSRRGRRRRRHRQLPARRARLPHASGSWKTRTACAATGASSISSPRSSGRDEMGRRGGDAANVTLFGESAGGTLVSLLGRRRAASGLFHRMIVQSGVPTAAPLERASRLAEELADEAGVDHVHDLPRCHR